MAFDQGYVLASPTGASLWVRRQSTDGMPRGIFLLSHGLAEHSLRYAPLARFLASRGYEIYAWDHRGHGHTKAPDAPPGRFAARDGEMRLIEDLATVGRHAVSNHPGLPVLLFGHSMGGMIAARAAETDGRRYAGLAIWNSNLNPGIAGRLGVLLLKLERFFKGSDVPSRFGPLLTFEAWAKTMENARTPFDWLSRDEAEVARYVADPLCGFDCSVSLWIDLIGMAREAGLARNLARLPTDMPVNLVGGSEDPATEKGAAMAWLASRLRAQNITNVNLTIYPGMRHETLKEFGREQAMSMLADWADSIVS